MELGPTSPTPVTRSVSVTRTYLQLPAWDSLARGAPPSVTARLVALPGAVTSVPAWRELYATIGGPYQWHDREAWSDAQLGEYLTREAVRVFRVEADLPAGPQRVAGMLELERGADGRVEVVYLGLHRAAHGVGLGRWLVAAAVDEARAMGGSGVWLHTCTLDGPAALPNYLARGFEPVRTEMYEASIPA